MTRRAVARVPGPLLGLVAAAGGVATAVPGVLVHGEGALLALAIGVPLLVLVALPAGWARIGYALGWAVGVGLLASPRGEGDYLVAMDVAGSLLLVSVLAGVVAALVTAPRPAGASPRSTPRRGDEVPAGEGT